MFTGIAASAAAEKKKVDDATDRTMKIKFLTAKCTCI
jgi:hypothetical protein